MPFFLVALGEKWIGQGGKEGGGFLRNTLLSEVGRADVPITLTGQWIIMFMIQISVLIFCVVYKGVGKE